MLDLTSSLDASAIASSAGGDTGTVIFSHFACCACCAPAEALPTATGFRSGPAASASLQAGIQFAPEEATIDDLAAYLRIGYWSYATDGDWTSGAAWDVSDDRVITFNVTNVSAAAADLARLAFDTWASVVDLTFVEQSGDADITFSDAEDGAYSFFDAVLPTDDGSPYEILSAFVNVGRTWLVANGDTPDSFGYQTYLHEIGHALGLGHSGPYNAGTSFEGDALFSIDSWQMTVMSYFDQEEAGVGTTSELRTPMLADIVALQALYGLADNETGDTVYGFNATAQSPVFDAGLTGSRSAYTIHDTGGTDTIDYSGHAANQRIDLAARGISDVGGGRGNVILGPTTVIERAITGAGNDVVFATADTVFIDGGDGDDTVSFSRLSNPLRLDLQSGSPSLVLVGVETVVGSNRDDLLIGDGRGITLIGGAGNDQIDGNGADAVSYASASSGVEVDLAAGTARDGDGGVDTLSRIGRVIGSASDDRLLGDGGDNWLAGGGGNDVLAGGAGDDTLFSGGADGEGAEGEGDQDVLFGGPGDDVLYVAGGGDEAWGGAGDDLIIATALGDGDQFSLFGGDGADLIKGSENGDTIQGGLGDDQLEAGDGDDLANAGGGNDQITGGRGRDELYGSGGDDTIDGGASHDRLYGGGGTDTLTGAAGDDVLFGGAGDDTLDGGDGDDEIRGASGDDRGLGGAGDDILIGAIGADDLSGGGGSDTLIGGRDGDILRGGAGDDVLLGQGGADVLAGQAGADLMNGASGDDTLDGGTGADALNGGSGNDVLRGGQGNDVLSGQSDIDTFVFHADDKGNDRVTDLTAGETVLLEGFSFSSLSDARAKLSVEGQSVLFTQGGLRVTFENTTIEVVSAAIVIGSDTSASSGQTRSLIRAVEDDPETDPADWDSLL